MFEFIALVSETTNLFANYIDKSGSTDFVQFHRLSFPKSYPPLVSVSTGALSCG